MATVIARYTDAQGNPASGTVYLSPAARAGIGEPPDIVTEKRVWADLDAQGSISIDVIPSDDPGWLIDGQMPYLVEERLAGLPFRSYWIGVPDAGVDLADVQPLDPDDIRVVAVPGGLSKQEADALYLPVGYQPPVQEPRQHFHPQYENVAASLVVNDDPASEWILEVQTLDGRRFGLIGTELP